MRRSKFIPLSEAPQHIADRPELSCETAEAILKYGFREHSLSAVSCRPEPNLGINLTCNVDFDNAEIYWDDNKVRGPGGYLVYPNVHISKQLLIDWIEMNWKIGQLLGLIDDTHRVAPIGRAEKQWLAREVSVNDTTCDHAICANKAASRRGPTPGTTGFGLPTSLCFQRSTKCRKTAVRGRVIARPFSSPKR